MKRKTQNILTTILGIAMIMAIIPAVFIITENLIVIIGGLLIVGVVMIYFKNNDARALTIRTLDKFKK